MTKTDDNAIDHAMLSLTKTDERAERDALAAKRQQQRAELLREIHEARRAQAVIPTPPEHWQDLVEQDDED